MKKSKKIIIIIIVILAALLIAFHFVNKSIVKRANDLSIGEISTEKMSDGVYSAHYELTPVKVAVNVTIKDGRIENIEITEHTNGRGKDAEKIVDNIIEKQSLELTAFQEQLFPLLA